MGSLTPGGRGNLWSNTQPMLAIIICSQIVSLVLPPAEYKRGASDCAFCQITLVFVVIIIFHQYYSSVQKHANRKSPNFSLYKTEIQKQTLVTFAESDRWFFTDGARCC